jgi:ATP-dependent helicase/nuclease subunit B
VLFQAERKSREEPRPARRIYTVPLGQPFLTVLAEALVAGDLPSPGGVRPGPLDLADMTILLPTRRATRALQEAFLGSAGGTALLLPKIRPIIGSGEEPSVLSGADDLAAGSGEIAAPIGEIERRLALAKLVLAWAEAQRRGDGPDGDLGPYVPTAARTPAQAARLARELARLMDAMEIEDVDPARMTTLVPETYAEHWGTTLAFLKIITEYWPAHLRGEGRISKMERDKALVLAQARAWEKAPPAAPVIVAGVMSSAPVVTEMLRVVAGLPNGAVVLPALDQTLDQASWAGILPNDAEQPRHPEHPQFGLKKLIDALGVRRDGCWLCPAVRRRP